MSDLNKRQITAWQHKEKIIDRARISEFINSLTYPIAFFDIELYTPAIPVFKGTKPYQQLPFLFSIHYLKSKNDDLAHDFFYANPGNDPRKEFVEACINKLEHFTSIIVFDSNLEQGVLNALIAEFPEYKKEIEFIKKKIIDIAPLFTKLHYFEPNTIGSMSLKNLFATILDSDLFEQLKINSGAQASFAYNDLQSETNEIILNQVKEELINYCKADTFATASLFKHLKSNTLI